MRAFALSAPGPIETDPLRADSRATPSPGPAEILVRVSACGVCRTDLHIVEGDLPLVRSPIVPGHQVVGRVERTGAGAGRFRIGDRVGIAWLRRTCGVCDACRRTVHPDQATLAEIGLLPSAIANRTIYAGGAGCDACKQTGYRGRTGIHELLVIDDDVRTLIMKSADAAAIRRAATLGGMLTLRQDGATKVLAGETTIEEVLRVTQDDLA